MKKRIAFYTLFFIVLLFAVWVPLWSDVSLWYFKYIIPIFLLLGVIGFALKSEVKTKVFGWALMWAALAHMAMFVGYIFIIAFALSKLAN